MIIAAQLVQPVCAHPQLLVGSTGESTYGKVGKVVKLNVKETKIKVGIQGWGCWESNPGLIGLGNHNDT